MYPRKREYMKDSDKSSFSKADPLSLGSALGIRGIVRSAGEMASIRPAGEYPQVFPGSSFPECAHFVGPHFGKKSYQSIKLNA